MRGGVEYQLAKNKHGFMVSEGFYYYPSLDGKPVSDDETEKTRPGRVPLWKQNINGPIKRAIKPPGISIRWGKRKCFELLELRAGKNPRVASTDRRIMIPSCCFF